MVIEIVRMALMNRTVQQLLAQGTNSCAPMEVQGEYLDAFHVHRCVMARRTVKIQRMKKQHVVSVQISFLIFELIYVLWKHKLKNSVA
jgi:hypothetical protein